MGYEVDFLPVGPEGRSGDAIALRFGDLHSRSDQTVVVIDGGFRDDGENIVSHIKNYYGTDRVDLVLSTHPDEDHINGLSAVLEAMDVGELWMHRPSSRASQLQSIRAVIRNEGRRASFQKSVDAAQELEETALSKGIPIVEPFTGVVHSSGAIRVVGPTANYYQELLRTGGQERPWMERMLKVAREVVRKARESWTDETLTDDGEISEVNNSSVITLLSIKDRQLLMTSDAGNPALNQAADYLAGLGVHAGSLRFVQVPHHGSKRNVGPTVLNRLLGTTRPEGQKIGTAFVSAAKEGKPKHPAKKVTNAFLRRGYPVHETAGTAKCHSHEAPDRPNWSASEPLALFSEVED